MAENTLQKQRVLLKAGIDRVANKLALPLETIFTRPDFVKSDDEFVELIRAMLETDKPAVREPGDQAGMIEFLCGLERDLKGLEKQFFPEDNCDDWLVDDSCLIDILAAASLISLILRCDFECTSFTKKVSNRAMLGLVEHLRDVYQLLVDASASDELKISPEPKPKEAA